MIPTDRKRGDRPKGYVPNYVRGHKIGRTSHCKNGHQKNKLRTAGYMTCRECDRNRMWIRKYNITEEQILNRPRNCESCGIHESDAPHLTLTVDHNHETGSFRGWLCLHCNKGIGCFEDNIELMEMAIKYLHNKGIPA
jgi:hypothetical protein